jgi:hypothetical protein
MLKKALFFLMVFSAAAGAFVFVGDGRKEGKKVYIRPESYADT